MALAVDSHLGPYQTLRACSWKGLMPLLVATAIAAGSALAQSKTTGELTGRVVDDTGGALPGVRVEIASPALIGGVRSTVTDRSGLFRFPELPPGAYTVRTSLERFRPVEVRRVVLTLGSTADVPVTMTLAAQAEVAVVADVSPPIDRASSETSTNLSEDYLQKLPTDRTQPFVLNLAPGINLGSAYGGAADSANAYLMDGVDTSDPGSGTPWVVPNYNIIKESQLVGLGAPAEYGGFTGVAFNSVTKSGGNELKGLAELLYTDKSLNARSTVDPALTVTRESSWDSTLQIGGPLKQDRLWFFLSAQYQRQATSSGGPLFAATAPRAFGKLTVQASGSNTVNAWVEWDRYDWTGGDGSAFVPLEATVSQDSPEYVWNASWQSVLSTDTLLGVAYAGYYGYASFNPASGYGVAGHIDAKTGMSNTNSTYFLRVDPARQQLNASLSRYVSGLFGGSHELKLGVELERSPNEFRYGAPTGVWYYDNAGEAPDPGTGSQIPVPYSLAFVGGGYDTRARNERLSAFLQDSFRVTGRLTINAGVRLDMNRGYVSQGQVYASNPLVPRIGFAWALSGDGRTLLKGHYGRYAEKLVGPHYYWVDEGAFEKQEIWSVFPSGYRELISEVAGSRYAIDPNLRHPYMDQVTLGLDREVLPALVVSGTLIYRKNSDFIETVSRDGVFVPVTGFVPAEGGDPAHPVSSGQRVTLYYYLNPGQDTLIVTNPEGLQRTYRAAMLTVSRRFSGNWQLLASYVYSKAEGTIDNEGDDFTGFGGNSPGFGGFLDTPNSRVNYDGHLTYDQTHQVKVQGSYQIPKIGLLVAANYTYHSGATWTRQSDCLLTDEKGDGSLACHAFPQGPVWYFAESRGSRRLPARNELDLRLEWQKAMGPGTLGLMLDVFNISNQGRAIVVGMRDGPTLGQPASVNNPRQVRLGMRYTF